MKKKRIFASLSAVLLSAATLHAFPVFAAGDTTVHLVTNGSLPYFTGAAVDLSDPNNDMYFVLQHTRGDMFLNSFGIGFSAFQGDGLTFPITAGEETDDWKLSYSLTGYETQSEELDITKAIQGKSALPQDVLTEMLEDTRQKVLSTSERITTLTAELNDGNSKIEEMKAEFNRIVSWSKIFDESRWRSRK